MCSASCFFFNYYLDDLNYPDAKILEKLFFNTEYKHHASVSETPEN